MKKLTRYLTRKQIDDLIEFIETYEAEWKRLTAEVNADGIIRALNRAYKTKSFK